MNRGFLLLTLAAFALSVCVSSAQETTATKKWTICVFLNGDNNLDSAGVKDVNEMEQVGSSDQVNIIVMHDRSGSAGTKIYNIKKDTNFNAITSPVVKDMPEQDMGDFNTLVTFFKYCTENFPAEHYMVDIWNHGAGWQKGAQGALIKGISYDDQSGNHITTPQLGEAAKQCSQLIGRKVDIFSYDACLMQMAEVGYEIKDYALVQVGSEETEPGDGWPYMDFLPAIVSNPAITAAEVGTVMTDKYVASYSGGSQGNQSVCLSAVNLEKFGEFMNKLNAFTNACNDNAQLTGVFKDTMAATQAFYYAQYKDLVDFLTKLTPKLSGDLKAKAQDLLDFVKNQVIIRNAHVGSNMANATGLSIYMPTKSQLDQQLAAYKELKFAADGTFDEFLMGLFYPNCPVLTVAGADVVEDVDGAVNPGDAIKLVVKIKNDGMKPGQNLTVSLTGDANATVLGQAVTVDEVPGGATVNAPAIEAKVADACPIDTKVVFTVKIVDAQGKEVTGQVEVLVKEKFEHKADVLLLVCKKDDAFTPLYKKALADGNVAFDTWDISGFGKPTAQTLKMYLNGVVIFNAPDTNDIGNVDLDALAAYLQAGGSLFITGQDIGYSIKDKPFYGQYLKSQFVQDSTGITAIQGKGPFAGVDFAIAGGDGANNQKWADEINPLAGATAVLNYKKTEAEAIPTGDGQRTTHYRGITGSGTAGVLVTGTFKVLYFSFGFEAISTGALRAKVMAKALELLKPTVQSRLAGLKALAEDNEVLYSSGQAAFDTAKSAEESYLKLTQDLVKSAKDEQTVKRSGIRELLRQLHSR